MIFTALIKLLVIAGLLIVLRLFFPTIVKGFKRIMFIIIGAMIIFAVVVTYSS
tara:strand:- start:250 stop:408 length:159 start_codon:yes stop_codon:yes gene_type:complete